MQNVHADFRKLRRGRSVPESSAPKEVFETRAQNGLEAIYYDSNIHGTAFELQRFMKWCHLNQSGPQQWHDAEPVFIDKQNGKSGCKRLRVISKLDPTGEDFHRRAWQSQTANRTPPIYASGFVKGRRRESAIMIQRCNKKRLIRGNRGYLAISHDVANAFPSPCHDRMDIMVDREAKSGSRIMKRRHRRARVILKGPGGAKQPVKLGCGATQGDTASPEMFVVTYDDPIASWEKAHQNTPHGRILNVKDPVRNKVVSTSLTTFADDAFRAQGHARTPAEVKERVIINDIQFNTALKEDAMGQNVDQKEV